MESFISDNFIPVKIHVKEQPATFKRFGARWTPTFVIFDADGEEIRRFEGFLPAEDLLAQLELALGHIEFARENWREAERRFQNIVDTYSDTEAAAEALYWAGVSRYKAGDKDALPQTAHELAERHQGSIWDKKASVWAA